MTGASPSALPEPAPHSRPRGGPEARRSPHPPQTLLPDPGRPRPFAAAPLHRLPPRPSPQAPPPRTVHAGTRGPTGRERPATTALQADGRSEQLTGATCALGARRVSMDSRILLGVPREEDRDELKESWRETETDRDGNAKSAADGWRGDTDGGTLH